MEPETNEREISRVVRTNAGMCALWQPESFEFNEFEDWEDWATEDQRIAESIGAGLIVPLNVGGDGVFQVAARWGEDAGLTELEQRCIVVSSDPYLFVSEGWLVFGGLEDVGDMEFSSAYRIPLAVGRYSVTVHLIDWKRDSSSVDTLPDFVIVLGPAAEGGSFRTQVQTFERR